MELRLQSGRGFPGFPPDFGRGPLPCREGMAAGAAPPAPPDFGRGPLPCRDGEACEATDGQGVDLHLPHGDLPASPAGVVERVRCSKGRRELFMAFKKLCLYLRIGLGVCTVACSERWLATVWRRKAEGLRPLDVAAVYCGRVVFRLRPFGAGRLVMG